MKGMCVLKDKHKGETGYIVGSGPSLFNLTTIGAGPIITLNQAIIAVEKLELPNKIYSMQKDGCVKPAHRLECPKGCEHDREPYINGGRPKKAALLLHFHESLHCYPDHPESYLFDNEGDFHISWDMPSVVSAINVQKLMGVKEIKLLCCDSYFGECHTAIHDLSGWSLMMHSLEETTDIVGYPLTNMFAEVHLQGIPHEWVQP